MKSAQSLVNSMRFVPPAGLLAKLHAIDNEDFSKVVKTAEKSILKEGGQITLTADEAVLGLKQYYALISLPTYKGGYAISSTLDPYWHAHILDTREYAKFCERGPGTFIHHIPLDLDNNQEFERVCDVYLKTGEDLRATFVNVSDKVFPPEANRDNVICLMYKD